MLASAFWLSQEDFPLGNIIGNDFQDFPDSHRTACHQFQNQPVSHLVGPKDDFIHGFLFQDVKLGFYLCAEQLAQHRRIAWVDEIRIEVVFGKIEKCQQAGESSAFGLGIPTFGELVHKVQDVVNG
jgi:hypothetical protein